jgi:zinc transporter 7
MYTMARRGAFRTAIASCVFVLAACAAASQIKGSSAAIDSLSLEELDGRLQVLRRFCISPS